MSRADEFDQAMDIMQGRMPCAAHVRCKLPGLIAKWDRWMAALRDNPEWIPIVAKQCELRANHLALLVEEWGK